MKADFVMVGEYAINLEQVTAAHWEKGKLFVHLVGGRFEQFKEQDAKCLWERICTRVGARVGMEAEELVGAV